MAIKHKKKPVAKKVVVPVVPADFKEQLEIVVSILSRVQIVQETMSQILMAKEVFTLEEFHEAAAKFLNSVEQANGK